MIHKQIFSAKIQKKSHFNLFISKNLLQNNWQRLLLSAASLFVSKCVSLSEYDRAVAHARGGSEGSQGCREDADDDLQDGLPSFFLHGAISVKVLNGFGFVTL